MEYSALHTTAALMRAKEDLSNYTDVQAIALKEVQAKETLKWDLEEATGYEYDHSEYETYLDNNESYLQEALSNLQLHYHFMSETAGQGSAADIKAQKYLLQYNRMRSRFKSLLNSLVTRFTTARIER